MTLGSGNAANGTWRSDVIPKDQIQLGGPSATTYDLWFQAIDVPNNASTTQISFTGK
jgi:hypothetical protein